MRDLEQFITLFLEKLRNPIPPPIYPNAAIAPRWLCDMYSDNPEFLWRLINGDERALEEHVRNMETKNPFA